MYAYGTFYDRVGDERIKIIISDDVVNTLLEARKQSDEEYEAVSEKVFEEHVKKAGVKKFVAYGGLMSAIGDTDGGAIADPIIADEEEFLIAYGYDEEGVKAAYYAAEEEYRENADGEWDDED